MDPTHRREAGPGLELIEKGPRSSRRPAANHTELFTRLSRGMRVREWSPRTEEAYLAWMRRFLKFHRDRTPEKLGAADVNQYLSYLANERGLSAKSRNQAASAIAHLFREIVGIEIGGHNSAINRGKTHPHCPTVLTRIEVGQLLGQINGTPHLMGSLLYGSGLRLMECMRLRVKDLGLDGQELTVRDGKGGKNRITLLPDRVIPPLERHLDRVRKRHHVDRDEGGGWCQLPNALHRKSPSAGYDLAWQFVFPATRETSDPTTGRSGRYHLHATTLQRAVKTAARRMGIPKTISCHTLRHSFATHMLRAGTDVRTVQQLMGRKSMRTTMIYLHPDRSNARLTSPLDLLSDD